MLDAMWGVMLRWTLCATNYGGAYNVTNVLFIYSAKACLRRKTRFCHLD
jgi:hypothetical protein